MCIRDSLVSASGFLPFGYAQIENEIVQYQALSTSPVGIATITRGIGGTSPATHAGGVAVTHLSLWVKGKRTPLEITSSASLIELPSAFTYPLELYVLSKARQAEQEFGEAAKLMQSFHGEIDRINKNPGWKMSQGLQVRPYGESALGGLAYGRLITR